MIFETRENEWYHPYWETQDKQFAIGVEKMLFGRRRVVILHSDMGAESPEWVIAQYPTYKPLLVLPFVFETMKRLEKVNPKTGREWWLVQEALPPKTKKYLEDIEEDREMKNYWNECLEKCSYLKKKYPEANS